MADDLKWMLAIFGMVGYGWKEKYGR